jgi:hypothetical protein
MITFLILFSGLLNRSIMESIVNPRTYIQDTMGIRKGMLEFSKWINVTRTDADHIVGITWLSPLIINNAIYNRNRISGIVNIYTTQENLYLPILEDSVGLPLSLFTNSYLSLLSLFGCRNIPILCFKFT